MSQTCRLTATLAADVVGYSRLMGEDEEGRSKRLKTHRRQQIDPKIGQHHGRIVNFLRWLGKVRQMSAIGPEEKMGLTTDWSGCWGEADP